MLNERSNAEIQSEEVPYRRFMMVMSYDGAPFNGWQVQPNRPSVQESVEKALRTVLNVPLHIVGAGRTDTGVNARTMVAHFDLPEKIGLDLADNPIKINRLIHSLNALLHPAIAVYNLFPVDKDCHARFDATARTYRYFLHTVPDPFRSKGSLYSRRNLNFELMNKEAQDLLGQKDFTSFSKLHTDVNNNICTVTSAKWVKYGPSHYYFEITANRFLRNMVRAVVGTLLDVGLGKFPPGHISSVLLSMNRCAAGTSVPGHALYLWNIEYPYSLPPIPLP